MTRTIAILIATTAIAAAVPANAGGVLLCNEFGCWSSPYFPPPMDAASSPVVYMPANPPVVIPPPPPPTVERPRQPEPPPQRDAASNEIEGDILAFCRDHTDEPFCGKLTAYLERTGRARK